jgi:ferredoxin
MHREREVAMLLSEHPAVRHYRVTRGAEARRGEAGSEPLSAAALRAICLRAGADDAGFVEIGRAELASERPGVLAAFPGTRTLVAYVCRMHQEPIRSPARSVSNLEFHHVGEHANEVARRIVEHLEAIGVRAVNPSISFPMEMEAERPWLVSHKTVAVAAGLGRMGIHRNVIHPRFGSFVLLGTVLMEAEVSEYGAPIDYNPCLECKLCVAACPVGAIAADGRFDFSACYTHNYREFMGGFADWVETIASSGSARKYREQVSPAETSSMWQSLAYGPNYKSAYCLAVCPAGDEVLAPFIEDRAGFVASVLDPLVARKETVYVVPGSDAEAHVQRRFPHKIPKRVHNGLRSASIRAFLAALPSVFQRGQAKGLEATFHLRFTGEEPEEATVVIRDQVLTVEAGLTGAADLTVTADSRTWLRFLGGDANLFWALLRRKIRLRGRPRLLLAFGRCFPS